MTYPLSCDVSAGQPTAADHYNHLRCDALTLGNDPADSVEIGTFLSNDSTNLNLARLGSNRLRLSATNLRPVAICVAGRLLKSSTNVDLSTSAVPSGNAATWYVFVQAEDGDSTLHLSINTTITPGASQRLIGSFYWDGSEIVPDSVLLAQREELLADYHLVSGTSVGGRLCLQTGIPFEHTDRTGLTVYFTPFVSKILSLYAPGADLWLPHTVEELSVTLPGTANKNYDLFVGYADDVITLSAKAWTSDTARAAALTLQDGRLVLGEDHSQLYLGTCRVNAAGVAADTESQRFLWNVFNQRPKLLRKYDNTTHTYQSITWRVWNNDSSSKIAVICGQEECFKASLHSSVKGSTDRKIAATGIGFNTPTASTKDLACYVNQHFHAGISYAGLTQLGLNEVYIVERAEDSYSATYSITELMAVWPC